MKYCVFLSVILLFSIPEDLELFSFHGEPAPAEKIFPDRSASSNYTEYRKEILRERQRALMIITVGGLFLLVVVTVWFGGMWSSMVRLKYHHPRRHQATIMASWVVLPVFLLAFSSPSKELYPSFTLDDVLLVPETDPRRSLVLRPAGYFLNRGLECPLPNCHVTSAFGMRRNPIPGSKRRWKLHAGLDLRARTPQPIYAPMDGDISFAGVSEGPIYQNYGERIDLFNEDWKLRFAHLSAIAVSHGQKVLEGDLIGYTGGTGQVDAPHLHFEARWRGASQKIEWSPDHCRIILAEPTLAMLE